jgi:hypothetical protein
MNLALDGIGVEVNGDAHLGRLDGVALVNGLPFDDYAVRVVRNDGRDEPVEVYGRKYFKNSLLVEGGEFWSERVNDVPLGRLFEEAMTASGDERVTGRHGAENVIAGEI